MNIVSTALQFLTPVITNRIASALGINNSLVNMAISAIVPTLLASLAGKAATPAGASALSDVLGKLDPNILGSFAGQLGGAGQADLVKNGTSILGSLLGGSASNALSGAVGKFAGVDSTASSALVGMLAPVVMGQLAKAKSSSGLDAGGLAKLLDGQKANIAAAMPAGFAQLLGGTGLIDSIAGELKTAAPAKTAPAAMPASSGFNWMPWAAGAVVLLGLWYAFSGSKPAPAPVPAQKAANPAAATEAIDKTKKLIAGLTSTLGNIKDLPTAQAAVPQLTTSSTAIDGLIKLLDGLPPEVKAQIAGMIATALPQIKPLIETVMKIPGAEALLKPALDAILTKLTGLSKA